jgi:hypothetical protein
MQGRGFIVKGIVASAALGWAWVAMSGGAQASNGSCSFSANTGWSCSGEGNANTNAAVGQTTGAATVRTATGLQTATVSNHIANVFSSTRAGRQSAMLNETGIAAGDNGMPYGLWLSGGITSLSNTDVSNDFKGTTGGFTAGFDYAPSDNLIVGLSVGREKLDLTTNFNGGTVDRSGYSLAPYAGYNFGQGTTVDLLGSYTFLDADVTRALGAGYGNYDGWRGMVATNAHHTLHFADLALRGDVGYLYSYESQGSYLETGSGATIAERNLNLSQGKIGARATYALTDTFEPYFQAHYTRDFVFNRVSASATTRQPDNDPNQVTLAIGGDWFPTDQASLGFEVDHGVARAHERVLSLLANARLRF